MIRPILLACCCLLALAAEEGAPRDVLFVGNYMFGGSKAMVATMLGRQGPVRSLYLAKDCHADICHNAEPWLLAWIAGGGTVAGSSWRDNGGGRKIAEAHQGDPFEIVVLQVDTKWLTDKRQAEQAAAVRAAIAAFQAEAAKAGARLVLYVRPDPLQCTAKRGKDKQDQAKTLADYEAECQAVDAGVRALASELQLTVAPTYLAFAELRRAHPELDIHEDKTPSDGHLSTTDSYLIACTIVGALSQERPDFGPVAACLEEANERIRRDNAKAEQAGKPTRAEIAIDEATATALQDAAWQAVLRFRGGP